jgi:hypothetical protein
MPAETVKAVHADAKSNPGGQDASRPKPTKMTRSAT